MGSVRVGLAGCDPDGILATPLRTVPREPAGTADLDEIAAAVSELDAVEVVVGLPRSLSGSEGAAAQSARAYATALAKRLSGVSVRLLDERLTTVDAQRVLREAGRSTRGHRAVVDQVAAVLILQTALELERGNGRAPGKAVLPRKPRRTTGRRP